MNSNAVFALCGSLTLALFSTGCQQNRTTTATQPAQDPRDEEITRFHLSHGALTDPGPYKDLYRGLPRQPEQLVPVVQGLIMHGGLCWLYEHQPAEAQQGGQNLRGAQLILRHIIELDSRPLTEPRPPGRRLLCNCRTFAVLLTSILRHQAVPARVRAGFASYTWGRGKYENHWICEYWNAAERRWVQVDAQIDAPQRRLMGIDFNTLDIPPGKFVLAGVAWQACRSGHSDPNDFGLGSRDGFNAIGWAMVRGTLIVDLAALNKAEPLPWDSSPLSKKDQDLLTEAELRLLDVVAGVSIAPDKQFEVMRRLFSEEGTLTLAQVAAP
ncbi:MAG: transglutaminase-like domain-containing protein [Phycisphaerae bacterium]|nr:transglutaminase-like domain-containing protein [Phycisphaerae bacterium]